MQGKKTYTPKMMYQVHLNNLVPQDNFYRKLDKALNLNFLYKETKPCYGDEGQESIDPVVFFKICLVGYLNNISSDRRLVEYCSNCLDVRLYIRYDIDEPLPWHSTISRTRQLFGEEIFLGLFKRVLSLCIEKGMVRGKRQAIDSAYIKANASLDSLVEKDVIDDVEKYCEELDENSEYKVTKAKKNAVESHHKWKTEAYRTQPGHNRDKTDTDENGNLIRPRYLSNHTHYSSTDPDSKISVKPGKPRQMNYSGQISVDDGHHVITAAMADFADKRDSQSLPKILSQAIDNLNDHQITIDQVAADTGYSSGEALRFCEAQKIKAYIPNHGQYKPEREGFEYDRINNLFQCTRGNKAILPLRKVSTDKTGYSFKTYRSNTRDCKDCPLRSSCIGKSTVKNIEVSIDKPYYDNMHKRMQTNYARMITRRRSSTVEPVLGTLINFLNMKRVNTRGIKQANKHVLMAALCYNLKKYMNFMSRKVGVSAMAPAMPSTNLITGQITHFFCLWRCLLMLFMLNRKWKNDLIYASIRIK